MVENRKKAEELLGVLYSGKDFSLAVKLLDSLYTRWQPLAKAECRPLTQRDCMLITYGDSITEEGEHPLNTLNSFLESHCKDEITNVHLLPVFPYTSDDGFSVSDYTSVCGELGDWQDVEALGNRVGVMMDAVINHTSKSHPWFQKCCAGEFPYTDYYIACDENADYSSVIRPRALPLLTKFETVSGKKWYWTTFSEDQVDLNFGCPYLLQEILEVLLLYASKGARFIRLDAIGFAWKRLGTTCMHLKETHALIKLMRLVMSEIFPGTYIITETNVPHQENISYFGQGDEAHLVYQFPLPPLVLYTMLSENTDKISRWAKGLEDTALPPGTSFFNFLASHDGIGVRPIDGILGESEKEVLFCRVKEHGGLISYKQNADGSKSPYELNINYLDALTDPKEPDQKIRADRFMAAQAIMLSLQGVPGIYYHSLLGSGNWVQGAEESGIPRKINREKLNRMQLERELDTPGSLQSQVFWAYLEMLRVRGNEDAFSPEAGQEILDYGSGIFALNRHNRETGHKIWSLINVTRNRITLNKSLFGKDILHGGQPRQVDALNPYEVLWLRRMEEEV